MTSMEFLNTAAHKARTALLLLAVCVIGPALAQDYERLDEIVAIVDEGVILRSELEAAILNIEAQIRARGERMPPRQVLEDQVLERLITREVQLQRAEMTGIRATDQQVDRALDDVARQNNLSLAQLRQAVESEGGDFNEFREDIRAQIITSTLQQRIVESMDEITETEIDILLESDYFGGDEYNLSQIALRVPPSATPAQLRQLEQRIGEIYDELRDGMDFAEAA
ncbi:MAG: SurA N-terminal domain-containing protein, partial [Wenzhouxiangellaceae bacterium]